MPGEPIPRTSFSRGRRWGIGFSVLVSTLAVAAIVGMVNYLGARHFLRFSLSRQARAELSPQTLGLLKSVTNRVKVVVYYDHRAPLYDMVKALVDEYQLACPNLEIQNIDYLADPPAALKVKQAYGLGSAEDKDLVIFECDGRFQIVDGKALGDYGLEAVANSTEREYSRKLKDFKGEAAFSSAVLSVIKPRPLKAYYLQTHREANPRDEGSSGYSKFNDILLQNYVQPALLDLSGANPVPADCNLLIIAGPQMRLPDSDVEKIKQYLQQGGRMLVLFHATTLTINVGLEPVLAGWGVNVGHNYVRDPKHSHSESGMEMIVSAFDHNHPLVNPLLNSSIELFLPRSISKIESEKETPDAPKVTELAFTGEHPYLNDKVLPEKAPIPLMAAVEKTGVKGVLTDRGLTRIAVIGDSEFLNNGYIVALDNHYFAERLVNWLLDQSEMLQGVGPREVKPYTLLMTRAQTQSVQWLFLAGMPGAVLLFGLAVWLRRRH